MSVRVFLEDIGIWIYCLRKGIVHSVALKRTGRQSNEFPLNWDIRTGGSQACNSSFVYIIGFLDFTDDRTDFVTSQLL